MDRMGICGLIPFLTTFISNVAYSEDPQLCKTQNQQEGIMTGT